MLSHLSTVLSLTLLVLPVPAQAHKQRCGTPERTAAPNRLTDGPTDCGYSTNKPQPEHAPSFFYDIPVVFHVIKNNSGLGNLSAATIRDQIEVLNEDFQAIVGSPGARGTQAKIRFHLASTDPAGQPTTGIVYSTSNEWFRDRGNYRSQLAWDATRYMNVYTNQASGYFGYITEWPSRGAGTKNDGIVLNWQVVGRKPTAWWPGNMGRTATHEVGHYLGLYHTFEPSGQCPTGTTCYSGNGDLICDTNDQRSPTLGCPTSKSSCGSSDPIHNYMDYTDDSCLFEFTAEQVNRMRCTLHYWRPLVYSTTAAQEVPRLGNPPNPYVLLPGQTSGPMAGEVWDPIVDHTSFQPGATADHMFISFGPTEISLPPIGTLLCSGPIPFVSNLTPGTAFAIPLPSDPGLLGFSFCIQVASQASGSFRLTNALDCTVGNR